MANYYSTCRTNYFKVLDLKKFKEWLNEWYWEGFELCEEENGTMCILCDQGWPNCKRPDYSDADFVGEFKSHLPEKEVVVLMEAGAEKHRYLCGVAVAFMKGRKEVYVDVNDIYEKAKKRFGVKEISSANY